MSTQTTDERPSRKFKSENRLYNFLSRSRSRPRSKDAHNPPPDSSASKMPVAPDSKPPVRLASRPLSSTTTATNATVTPGTLKAKPRPIAAIIVSPISSTGLESQIPSQSMIPNPPSSRKKLHNLFGITGITLPSPKKSSFGSAVSQPSSSRSSLDVPPLPAHASASNPVPRHRRAFSREHSPANLSKMRQNGSRLSTSLTDISNAQCASAANMFHRFFSGSKGNQAAEKPPIAVSGPLRRPSHHKNSNSESQHPTTGKPRYSHEPSNSLSGPSAPPLPHIIYTPATPDRRTALSTSSPSSPPAPPRKSQDSRKVSIDSGHRSLKGKEKESSSRQKPEKVEVKPDFGGFQVMATALERGGSDTSNLTEWNKHLERLGPERDSSFGPGLAGVGTLQRDMSLKRGKDREEQVRAREAERRKQFRQQRKQPDATIEQTDHTAGSTSTIGTGHSSSWGRAAGKRSALSGKTASGSGLPKAHSKHPAFDFEPPVPSSLPWNSVLQDSPQTSNERPNDGKKGQKTESKEERPSLSIPAPATIGHRSALKGRSLDLGLGFAWAPSSVREEVLLPALGRSFSQTSSVTSGPSTAGKSNGKRDAIYEDNAEGVSKLGKEVAAVFKNSLDHDGFVNFRKYVHQFDAHEIPFDGPTGITTRVEQLLGESSRLKPQEKKQLMDQLVRIILRNA
ncbi:hypothetical protein F5887DRAFT_938336 [Amanita rubescens]|nr:hypothetical protein F5887DRAFT_938336 [Amanita rubescens]